MEFLSLKEKALKRTAEAIKFLDAHVLLSENLPEGKSNWRGARLLLYNILEENGYELSQNYKPVKAKINGYSEKIPG